MFQITLNLYYDLLYDKIDFSKQIIKRIIVLIDRERQIYLINVIQRGLMCMLGVRVTLMILFQFFNDNFFQVSAIALVGFFYSFGVVFWQKNLDHEEHRRLSEQAYWFLINFGYFLYNILSIYFIKKSVLKKGVKYEGYQIQYAIANPLGIIALKKLDNNHSLN